MAMGPMPRALDWAAIHPEAMHSVEHTLPPMLCTLGYLDSTEGRRVSGKEFLTAFVAAQETLIRIGIRLSRKHRRAAPAGATDITFSAPLPASAS